MKNNNLLLTIAALCGGTAVILGAFGAHGLENAMPERYLEIYNTGVDYQIYHSLALLAVALSSSEAATQKRLRRAFWAWFIGILIFSGSLYLLAFTQMNWLGMITPFGGVAFITGWFLLLSWGKTKSKTADDK